MFRNNTSNNFIPRRAIRQSGSSSIITIPREVMETLNLKVGDELSFEYSKDRKSVNLKKIDNVENKGL